MPTKRGARDTTTDEGGSEHDSAAEVEEVAGASPRRTKGRASDAKDASENDDDHVATTEEDDGAVEGEYEIERIIKHKMGHLETGIYSYFVKWKGYGDEENSWVNEPDAGGASELIDEYWHTRRLKGAKAKQTPVPVKGRRSQQGRKASSEIGDESRPTSSVKKSTASTSAKRARASNVRTTTPEPRSTAGDEDMDEVEEPPRKKAKPQTSMSGKKARLSKADASPELDTEQEITPVNAGEENSMDDDAIYDAEKQFKKSKDWSTLADFVTTVERDSGGTLIVYFQGVDGLRYKAKSAVFRVKSPGKLLDFYESNLKWRPQQPDDVF